MIRFALWLALALLAAPLSAQDAAAPPPAAEAAAPAAAEQVVDWAAWEADAARAREVIDRGAASPEALASLREQLETRRAAAAEIAAAAAERIKGVEEELAALGPAPDDRVEEAPEAAELRAEVSNRLAAARAQAGRAGRAVAQFRGLLDDLADLGQRRFADRLYSRGPTPLTLSAWLAAQHAVIEVGARIRREVLRTLDAPSERAMFSSQAPLAAIAILAGGFVLFGLRGMVVGLLTRAAGRGARRVRRILLGVGATAARVLTAVLAAGLILYGVGSVGLLGVVGDAVLRGLGGGLGVLILVYGIAAALFSPQNPALRLTGLDDATARAAFRAPMGVGLALALNAVVAATVEASRPPEDARAVLTLITVGLGAATLYRLARVLRPTIGASDAGLIAQGGRVLSRWALAAAVIAPVLALLGYAFAAEYVLFPTIRSLGVIAVAYLIYSAVRAAVEAYLEGDEGQSTRLRLIPVFVGFALICAALPVLALLWGATTGDLRAVYIAGAEGLTVGEVTISPLDFLVFALVFGVGYSITRLVQNVLRSSVLPQAGMSAGGASALTSGVGYVGVFLAALAAISATGLDLSNLAIVAGALSVGVGFGLQTIVNNFVSGVILLVERPIKVGDWIEVGDQSGYVKKVNVRSTEIETFDQASYIVPNSDLIASPVLNWTLSSLTGRVRVPVGVGYDSDPRQVERILLEIGRAHPMVIANPAPTVYFMRFGADSLDFELRVYLRDINWMLTVTSDLNFRIAQRFTEEGIEIPYAQSDITLKNADELGAALRGAVREGPQG